MRMVLAIAGLVLGAASVRAELAPDEVAVIAMSDSAASRRLAAYYLRARGIPQSNACVLPGRPGNRMSREFWETQARPRIRQWLAENKLENKIRCFVPCGDVPLTIGKRSADDPRVEARGAFLQQQRAALVEETARVIESLDRLAPVAPKPTPPQWDASIDLKKLSVEFDSAFKAARMRVQTLDSKETQKQAGLELKKAFMAGAGLAGLLKAAASGGLKAEDQTKGPLQLQRLVGQLQGFGEGIQALGRLPDSVARDLQILRLLRKNAGLVGTLRWIDTQRELLERNETLSSFDSELSMLLWPDYSLYRWQPNLLHYQHDDVRDQFPPTLMVSRLTAPSLQLAGRLVETAIATEKTGLSGKFYIDARGMGYRPGSDKPGSYAHTDAALRDLAERLKKHTQIDVVLNNEGELFQPGECPDAALYCGWYSLGAYVDAFDWKPGAVGYHIASSEATTLAKPGGKVWCNAMLEDGICATLGPAFEPYLASFPNPDDFFPLLLTGRYTLAEVYYRTKPFNSWAMVLVGDPLYNPFRNRPQLSDDALPARMTGGIAEPEMENLTTKPEAQRDRRT